MIDVDGPNCGYYLGLLAVKPLQIEFVKEATYPQDLDGKGLPGRSRLCNFQRTLSRPRGQLRLVSQKSRGEKRSQNPT